MARRTGSELSFIPLGARPLRYDLRALRASPREGMPTLLVRQLRGRITPQAAAACRSRPRSSPRFRRRSPVPPGPRPPRRARVRSSRPAAPARQVWPGPCAGPSRSCCCRGSPHTSRAPARVALHRHQALRLDPSLEPEPALGEHAHRPQGDREEADAPPLQLAVARPEVLAVAVADLPPARRQAEGRVDRHEVRAGGADEVQDLRVVEGELRAGRGPRSGCIRRSVSRASRRGRCRRRPRGRMGAELSLYGSGVESRSRIVPARGPGHGGCIRSVSDPGNPRRSRHTNRAEARFTDGNPRHGGIADGRSPRSRRHTGHGRAGPLLPERHGLGLRRTGGRHPRPPAGPGPGRDPGHAYPPRAT